MNLTAKRSPGWPLVLLVLAACVLGALAPIPAGAATPAVPVAPVALPVAVDWQAEYQGQVLCSPEPKPGALALSNLLATTYGRYTTYITRSCQTAGVSEHEEGRALDWMVDSESPEARAKAWQFLDWLTAAGPNGELGANARRLGVMYLIYEDKMWRVYRPQDGWTEYQGCSGRQGEGEDTVCHRDHIHISLSWDGAYAATSFWTGQAETRPPCSSGATTVTGNGSLDAPLTLLNGNRGITTTGSAPCRPAAKAYSSRSYRVTVPVPATDPPVQQVQVVKAAINAPTGITLTGAQPVTVPTGVTPGSVFAVPVADDGVVTVSLAAGYADVVLRAVGTGAPALTPPSTAAPKSPAVPQRLPRIRLRQVAGPLPVFATMAVEGRVRAAPPDAAVVIYRRTRGMPWQGVGLAAGTDGPFAIAAQGASVAGRFRVKAVLRSAAGDELATSKVRRVVVAPSRIGVRRVSDHPTGLRVVGRLRGVPPVADVLVQVSGSDRRWRTIAAAPQSAAANRYRITAPRPAPGRLRVRAVLRTADTVLDRSNVTRIRVGAAT